MEIYCCVLLSQQGFAVCEHCSSDMVIGTGEWRQVKVRVFRQWLSSGAAHRPSAWAQFMLADMLAVCRCWVCRQGLLMDDLIVVLAAWLLTLWPLPWVWDGGAWGPLVQSVSALARGGVQVLT